MLDAQRDEGHLGSAVESDGNENGSQSAIGEAEGVATSPEAHHVLSAHGVPGGVKERSNHGEPHLTTVGVPRQHQIDTPLRILHDVGGVRQQQARKSVALRNPEQGAIKVGPSQVGIIDAHEPETVLHEHVFVHHHVHADGAQRVGHLPTAGPVVMISQDCVNPQTTTQPAYGGGARGDMTSVVRDQISREHDQIRAQRIHLVEDRMHARGTGMIIPVQIGEMNHPQAIQRSVEAGNRNVVPGQLRPPTFHHDPPGQCEGCGAEHPERPPRVDKPEQRGRHDEDGEPSGGDDGVEIPLGKTGTVQQDGTSDARSGGS